jgi:hypothetical protein
VRWAKNLRWLGRPWQVGWLGFSRFFVSFFIDWKKDKPVRLEDNNFNGTRTMNNTDQCNSGMKHEQVKKKTSHSAQHRI